MLTTPPQVAAAQALPNAFTASANVTARVEDVGLEFTGASRRGGGPTPAVVSSEACGIAGLYLVPDFITAEEEEALLAEIDLRHWDKLARRRVQHYGKVFDYKTRHVHASAAADDFPPHAAAIATKISSLPGVEEPFDQLTINEYPIGVGLSPHIDTHSAFGDVIASLSLAGSASMLFRRDGVRHSLLLPARSLLVMSGEARLAWDHYIPHRKSDLVVGGHVLRRAPRRVSLTYRTLRRGPCLCPYPTLCDSQEGLIPPTRMAMAEVRDALEREQHNDEETDIQEGDLRSEKLEIENVVNVYDAIAPHFSATRFAVWPAVRKFIDGLPSGALVADVGCGNGKYFGLRRDIFTSGSDRSSKLASVAAKRLSDPYDRTHLDDIPRADVAVADALHLPYREGCCDAVLCVAVLHHMSTVDRRIELLTQLTRALAPGGRAFVTVWATEQESARKMSKWERLTGDGSDTGNDYLVPWHLPLHRAEAAAAASRGTEVDREKNTVVFRRYYHLFEQKELEDLVVKVAGATVVESFYDKDNWCVVVQKDARL